MKDQKSFFKEWLEKLQQESWQLELLISGFALYGIIAAKGFIDDFDFYLETQFFSSRVRYILNIFSFILQGAWLIFVINLIIHIVLRGLWIGAIGLRYVSGDIDYEKLNFSESFKKLYQRRYESFDDYIEDLEKICSIVFSYTFLLFFILISASLFLLWPMVFSILLGSDEVIFFNMVYVILGLIVFVDFILINPIKKIKDRAISNFYKYIFRFYSTITLSFLFRYLLLNFLDQKFTKRLFLLSIPYAFIIILVVPKINFQGFKYFPHWGQKSMMSRAYNSLSMNPMVYDNLNKEKFPYIEYVSLKSNRVDDHFIEFFLPLLKSDEAFIENNNKDVFAKKTGFFTNFRMKTSDDPIIKEMNSDLATSIRTTFENKNQYPSEQAYNAAIDSLEQSYEQKEKEYYASRLTKIQKEILSMNKFYIDSLDVSGTMTCYYSAHDLSGQNGWKCFIPRDSLSLGAHTLKIERGIYSTKTNAIKPIELKIPFILDH